MGQLGPGVQGRERGGLGRRRVGSGNGGVGVGIEMARGIERERERGRGGVRREGMRVRKEREGGRREE